MPKVSIVGGDFSKGTIGFFNRRCFSLPSTEDRAICETISIKEINYLSLATNDVAKFYKLEESISELNLSKEKHEMLCYIRFNDKRNLLIKMDKKYFSSLKQLFLKKEAIPQETKVNPALEATPALA